MHRTHLIGWTFVAALVAVIGAGHEMGDRSPKMASFIDFLIAEVPGQSWIMISQKKAVPFDPFADKDHRHVVLA